MLEGRELFRVHHTSVKDVSEAQELMLRQNIGKRISEAFMCVQRILIPAQKIRFGCFSLTRRCKSRKKEQRIHFLFEVKTFILTELPQRMQLSLLVNSFV